jgi:hypothetical protein
MAQDCIWLWDNTNKLWVKAQCDADGKLLISDADPFTVAQATPENLKHVPHGYYAVGDVYLPLAVDEDGVLQTSGAVAAHHTTHENAGSDEISVLGLSGLLADGQTPLAHKTSHQDGGSDELALDGSQITSGEVADARIPTAIARDAEVTTAISNHTAIAAAHFSNVITITFIIDGGGSAITTGQKGHLEIPFACTLTAWTLAADVAGAIVIDVWKDTYANFPPTDADAMPGGGKEPTIAATNQKAQDTDISDWTTVAIAAGNILAFNVDSCTTITRVTLSLKATKT